MNHQIMIRKQMLHLVWGFGFVVMVGTFAVLLDLLSRWIGTLGVSDFTDTVMIVTAHTVMMLGLLLFFSYLFVASVDLLKGVFANGRENKPP